MRLQLSLVERLLARLNLLPAPILDAFGSVLFGRALTVAVRRGVFEALRGGPREVNEIALLAGLNQDALGILLDALTVAGYLRERGGRYGLSPAARKWLLADSPSSLTSLVGYFGTLYERWNDLERSMEKGGPSRPYYDRFGDDDWRLYVYAMRDLARYLLPHVLPRIPLPVNARSLLDVGGSHGLYASACCRKSPGLSAVVVDFPAPLRWTAEILREEGMEGRILLLGGDLRELPFPANQDVVLLFNVLHGLSVRENRALCGRLLECLRPGGVLVVLEQCRETVRRSDLSRFLPAMVGLNLLNEIGGRAYAVEEVRQWCQPARLVQRIPLYIPGLAMITARR